MKIKGSEVRSVKQILQLNPIVFLLKAFSYPEPAVSLLANSEFKIPRRRRRQKRRLKSDFSIYETLAQLSQLGHYVSCRQTLLELNSEEKYPGLQRVRGIRRRKFTLSIKREIRQFTS